VTFSIVARAADGSAFGVAVASKFLAVGAAVPAAEAGVGALATQAHANLRYRADGLALLRAGRTARDTADRLTAADDGRDDRQLGVVAARGDGASFTGARCHDWAGGVTGEGYAIQGNLHDLYFGRSDPDTLLDLSGDLAGEVSGRLARLGHTAGRIEDALATWAGVENLEERLVPGRIDPVVLSRLRHHTTPTAGNS
jgi:uncharacterized Ntn-hydrolase superfamily protein